MPKIRNPEQIVLDEQHADNMLADWDHKQDDIYFLSLDCYVDDEDYDDYYDEPYDCRKHRR